jgi:hypothetical protein
VTNEGSQRRDTITDPEREWGIYRCAHGCVHLTLERLTLTLSMDELKALQELLYHASREFRQPVVREAAGPRPH